MCRIGTVQSGTAHRIPGMIHIPYKAFRHLTVVLCCWRERGARSPVRDWNTKENLAQYCSNLLTMLSITTMLHSKRPWSTSWCASDDEETCNGFRDSLKYRLTWTLPLCSHYCKGTGCTVYSGAKCCNKNVYCLVTSKTQCCSIVCTVIVSTLHRGHKTVLWKKNIIILLKTRKCLCTERTKTKQRYKNVVDQSSPALRTSTWKPWHQANLPRNIWQQLHHQQHLSAFFNTTMQHKRFIIHQPQKHSSIVWHNTVKGRDWWQEQMQHLLFTCQFS